jgi:hypothetical protein
MKGGDLTTGLAILQRGAKKLRDAWAETKESWHDKTSNDFEAEHLQTLMAQLTMTAAAVHRLADVLRHAEQACGDHERDA